MPKKKRTPKKTDQAKSVKSLKPVKAARKTAPRKNGVKAQKTQTAEQQMAPETHTTSQAVSTNARNPRLWIGLGIVVLVILVVAFKGLFIAAIVNGQPISRLQVLQQLEKQNGKQALSSLVTQTLITQEAAKKHVSVSQADVNSDLKKIDDALKAQGQNLDTALAVRGLSKQDLVQQITLQKLVEKMVGKDVKVTDADVQKYIDNNQDTLPKDLSDDQLRAQVKQQLEQQQLQDKTQAFVANLQKKANISYFVSY